MCEWYLLCRNEATSTEDHPILGAVPICDRCKRILDALAPDRHSQRG